MVAFSMLWKSHQRVFLSRRIQFLMTTNKLNFLPNKAGANPVSDIQDPILFVETIMAFRFIV